MILFLILIIIIILILSFLMLINFLISKKDFKNREKMSPFECGFDPLSKSRLPFSLQFYLISIIFLIFDVEIALVLPFVYFMSIHFYFIYFNMMFILLILLLGLYFEWWEGAFKWFTY